MYVRSGGAVELNVAQLILRALGKGLLLPLTERTPKNDPHPSCTGLKSILLHSVNMSSKYLSVVPVGGS